VFISPAGGDEGVLCVGEEGRAGRKNVGDTGGIDEDANADFDNGNGSIRSSSIAPTLKTNKVRLGKNTWGTQVSLMNFNDNSFG
jgi:hypothetical protein